MFVVKGRALFKMCLGTLSTRGVLDFFGRRLLDTSAHVFRRWIDVGYPEICVSSISKAAQTVPVTTIATSQRRLVDALSGSLFILLEL